MAGSLLQFLLYALTNHEVIYISCLKIRILATKKQGVCQNRIVVRVYA